MSYFHDRTLKRYPLCFSNSDNGFLPYVTPPQWSDRYFDRSGAAQYPELPAVAVDSIHGNRIVAVGDNVGDMYHVYDGACSITCVQDTYAIVSTFGRDIWYYSIEFTTMPNAGPGLIATMVSGDTYVLQVKNSATSWLAYKVTMIGGLISTWDDETEGTPTTDTMVSCLPYQASIFDIIDDETVFTSGSCTSVIGYEHTDSITADADLKWHPDSEGDLGYLQFIVPTTQTMHAWPFFLSQGTGIQQFSETFRSIVNTDGGYIFQTDDDTKLRMINLLGAIWIDGVTCDGVGMYLNVDPDTSWACAVTNCSFVNAEIGIRTRFSPLSTGWKNTFARNVDHYILQNLFLNCVNGISDDLVTTYIGTDNSSTTTNAGKAWENPVFTWNRKIRNNTFDGGDRHLTLQTIELMQSHSDVSYNTCLLFKDYDIKAANCKEWMTNIGNISSGVGFDSTYGDGNRCDSVFEFSEEVGHGYRPSLGSWFEYEMLATSVPSDCVMTADITGVRPPFFPSLDSNVEYARPALLYREQASRIGFATSLSSSPTIFERSYAPYSNQSKGCFNPVPLAFGNHQFFSVGRNDHNLLANFVTADYNYVSTPHLTGLIDPNGILRIIGGGHSSDIGAGDVFNVQIWNETLGDYDTVELACMQVIGPGVYVTRLRSGEKYVIQNITYPGCAASVLIYSCYRAFGLLQDAIDSLNTTYPDLVSNGKMINIICYDDDAVTVDHVRDLDGENGCLSIPAAWTSDVVGRIRIIATNSRNFSLKPQSHGGKTDTGFTLRYDGTAPSIIEIGANSQYVGIFGLVCKGEVIRQATPPRSYIGVTLDPTVIRSRIEGNAFRNCYYGVYQLPSEPM